MPGLRDILDAAAPGRWRASMAAIFAGEDSIAACRGDDFDVVDANARLIALAPELAPLALDMGEEIREIRRKVVLGMPGGEAVRVIDKCDALLARLDQLGKEPSDG